MFSTRILRSLPVEVLTTRYQAAPGRFQLLEFLVVDDLVDLLGQLAVDRRLIASTVVKTSSPMICGVRQRLLGQRLDRFDARLVGVAVGLNSFLSSAVKSSASRPSASVQLWRRSSSHVKEETW